MKKIYIFFLSILVFSTLAFSSDVKASSFASSGVPYQTYTLGEYGRVIPTQTAYLPVGVYGSELSLNNPQDIYYSNEKFYIADTGNKRILVLNLSGEIIKETKLDEFKTPTGVFVKDYIYVADKEANAVFKIDYNTDEIVQTITKPTSPIFGQNNNFLPTKVVVGSNDSIYIVGEGSTSGIIQVNYAGEFIGYLGINTVEVSFRKWLYNLFVKEKDLAASQPPSPTNIALGEKGSILTTNVNVKETFKRLNISGINTLYDSTIYPTTQLADIWMNDENYIYMVSSSGEVYEYDANGNFLFLFQTKDVSHKQTLGLTANPSGIVSDSSGNLYILDKNNNNIQIYQRTVFVNLVHEAVTLYNNGHYLESKPIWEEILRQNTSFALAHSALGSALTKEGKHQEALSEFFAAKDYNGYSNAFWEIRNTAIQENLSLWLFIFVLVFFSIFIFVRIFRKVPAYNKYLDFKEKVKTKKTFGEILLSLKIMRKPSDVVYFVKRKEKGSYLSGAIVFFAFLIVYLINIYGSGFLFRNPNTNSIFIEALTISGVFLLYVIMNYLVSTFSDGEGRLKDVFVISAYSLMPFIILTLPMTLLSHILTFNEAPILSFYNNVILVYTAVLLIYSIKEVHNYTFWETVKSIILILFGILITVLMGLLIYSFIGQVYDFIVSIIKEVIYRE